MRNLNALTYAVLGALLLIPGCLTGCASQSDSTKFSTDVATGVKAAQDLGLEATATIYAKPNGFLAFGPAFIYGNDSYAVINVKADPSKAKLQETATGPQ